MPAPVIKDPTHPDFPHGEPRGYHYGCRKECCGRPRRLADKRARLLRERGITRNAPEHLRQRVRDHITSLTARDPGVTLDGISVAAGVGKQRAGEVMRGQGISTEYAHRILNVTAEQVLAQAGFGNASHLILAAGQLQALGYPIRWQERHAGAGERYVALITARVKNGGQNRVATHLLEAWRGLLAEYGHREATPDDGIEPKQIKQAMTVGRRNGYYPPACYNEDGTLDKRAIPGHPWSLADAYAHDCLDALRLVLARSLDERNYVMARILGLTDPNDLPTKDRPGDDTDLWTRYRAVDRRYRRALRHFRLRQEDTDPGRAARLRDLRTEWETFENGSAEDVVTFVLRLGLGSPTRVVSDHPGLVAYREWLDEQAAAA